MKIRSLLSSFIFVCSSCTVAATAYCAESASVTTKSTASKSSASAKPVLNKQEVAANSALVVDLKTNEVLYSSNPNAVMPIASVTKLMTAMVTLDAKLPMDQKLAVNISDTKEMRGVYSGTHR